MSTGSERPAVPAVLAQLLGAVERRRRRLALLHGAAAAAVAVVVGATILAVIDAVALPSTEVRRWLSVSLYAAGAVIVIWLGVRPWLRRRNPAAVARAVERVGAVDDEQLSAAVELAAERPSGVSAWMVDRTIALASNAAAGVDPRRVVDDRPARRWATAAAVLVALLLLSLLEPSTRTFILRAVIPGVDLVRPSATALSVQPGGSVRLARGSDLRIVARVDPDPDRVRLAIAWDDGLVEELPMVPDGGGRFVRSLRGLSQPCSFRVLAGDAESAATRIELDEPPRVEGVELLVRPPEYTGQGPRREPGGDGDAPIGSRIELSASISGASVRSAVLVEEGGRERAMTIEDGLARCGWQIDATTTYGLRLVSADGLVVEPAQRWRIEVHPDAEPSVSLSRTGGDKVGPEESVILELAAEDDLGLRSVAIAWRAPDGSTGRQDVPVEALTEVAVKRLVPLDLGRFGLAVGDRVTLHAEAKDRGGQVARSDELTLQVTEDDVAAGAALSGALRARLSELRDLRERWRTWEGGWTGLRLAYRGEDHALHRGTVLVHRSALAQSAGTTQALAEALDGLDGTELVATHAHRIALALRDWEEGRLATVAAQVAPMSGGTPPQDAERRVGRAERAAGRAGSQLDLLVDWLQLLAAAHDATVLEGTSGASFARLERGLTVLRARRAWIDPRVDVGLRRALYRGTNPAGAPVHTDVAMPRIDDKALPEVGKNEYSVRWKGEIRIPAGSGWHIGFEVDDGVRVAIDGKQVIGKEAWQDQGPTVYVGAIMREGPAWLPIEIAYYQGGGGALLKGWLQRDAKRTALDESHLRHRIGGDLLASMLRLSPAQVERASLAAAEEMAALQVMPKRADKLALEGGADRIHGRVRDLREHLAQMEELRQSDLGEHGQLELESLAAGYAGVPRLAAVTAKELRRLLASRAKDLTPAEEGLGRLAQRAQVIREDLEPLRSKRDEIAAKGTLEHRAEDLRADAEVLADQLRRAQRDAHDGARAAAAGVAERLRQVELEVGLAELVHRDLAALEDRLAELESRPEAAAEAIKAAAGLRDDLKRLAQVEEALAEARLAGDARDALAADDRVRAALAAEQTAQAGIAGEQRNRQLATLGDELRRSGREESAERIQDAARETAIDESLDRRPRSTLEALARSDAEALARADTDFRNELEQLAKAWEAGHDAADAVSLEALPLTVDAGAEQLHRRGQAERAQALEQLAEALRAMADDPNGVTPEGLRELAARSAEATEAVAEAAPDTADSAAMGELARGLSEGDAEAMAELDRLAASDLAARMARADAALGLADRLDAMRQALAQAEAEERAAVDAFAAAERALAERMRGLEEPDASIGHRPLADAVAAAAGALPQHAERAAQLAHAAERAVSDDSPLLARAGTPEVDAGAGQAGQGDPAEQMAADAAGVDEALALAEGAVQRAEAAVAGDPAGLAAGLQRAATDALASAREAATAADELAAAAAAEERPAAAAAAAEQLDGARARAIEQAGAAESLARNAESLARGGLPRGGTDPHVADALSREAQREADRLAEMARTHGPDSAAAAAAVDAQRRAVAAHGDLSAQLHRAPAMERAALAAGLEQRLSAADGNLTAMAPEARGAMAEELAAMRATPAGLPAMGASDGERQRLAAEAMRAAADIENDLVRPVAEAHGAALGSGQSSPEAAAFGQELAALAAEQRSAAERLSRAMGHRDGLRRDMADGLAQAESLRAGPGAPSAPSPAMAEALAQQQTASEAWGAASAGGPEAVEAATRAQQAATQAQAQALGGQAGMLPAAERQRAVASLDEGLTAMRALPGESGTAGAASAAAGARQQLAHAAASQGAAAAGAAEALRQQANDLLGAGSGEASPSLTRAAAAAKDAAGAAGDPAAAGQAASEIMAAAASAERLSAAASGATTLAMAAAQGQGSSPGQPGPPGQSGQPGQPGQPGSPSGQEPGSSTAASDGSSEGLGMVAGGDPGSLVGFDAAIAGEDQAAWARLPERVRQAVRRGEWERFGEEHQAAIRAYFTALSEEE